MARTPQRLLRVTQEALERGIRQVRVGGRISDIGHAVQQHVESHGFSVVREFVGHGIGVALHEEPQIANYGEPGRGPRMVEGMVFAIEPMVNMGRPAVKVLADGWTAVTRDGSLSAHFEHTVAVTKNGPDVLTMRPSTVGTSLRLPGLAGSLDPAENRPGTMTEDDPREAEGGTIEGTVLELLPHGLYRVGIERQRQVTAHVPSGPGRNFIRVIVGDRVRLRLSPRDLTRGRIVEVVR